MRSTTPSPADLDPVDPPTTGPDAVPNHHAAYPGFAGAKGALVAVLFAAVGRDRGRLANDLAGVGRGDRVVDIGCGPGNAAREAARRGATAVGVDPAPVMLRVARLLTRPGRRVDWRTGSAESLPAPDGSATIVWSIACVHHWDDVDGGLVEIHRVLTSGGRLLAIERRSEADAHGVAGHGWTDDQADRFAEQCRAAGFTEVAISRHGSDRGEVLAVRATRP